ncbi:hypothetical protein BDN72DRAFT_837361 [Pluteus cervinus]|uniref:Uncharacterized protein n=1 Tax=Pluteus cervinus TaxID=181527 RepID=A0ACD3B111_9AGAR|nr:hypothetical protein BDN72DRAFT_837361 [Pluteus cervinus]
MATFPPEIWAAVFAQACLDQGHTGRAISLVSKAFENICQPFKLQSLAVRGMPQVTGCIEMLQRTPVQFRAIKYLFISSFLPPEDNVEGALWDADTEEELYEFILALLSVARPTVQVLHIVFGMEHPCLFPPIDLPCVTDLTLQGPICFQDSPDRNVPNTAPFLRRLSITDTYDFQPEWWGDISKYAPNLTHLHLARWSGFYLDTAEDIQQGLVLLPASLVQVIIHPGANPGGMCGTGLYVYTLIKSAFDRLAAQDKRIILESPAPRFNRSAGGHVEGEKEWLQTVNRMGGIGHLLDPK